VPHPRIAVIEKPPARAPATHPADPDSAALAARYALARSEHEASTHAVREAITTRGLEAHWLLQPTLPANTHFDLILSVGGDGTFLLASRLGSSAPLLGVNSSPSTSIGRYCAAHAATLGPLLDAIIAGTAPIARLLRLHVTIDDAPLPFDALNDALFAARCPVTAARYAFLLPDGLDIQLSSGIWVATPTGSTGAIRSAGGEVVDDSDGRLQWRVREPFIGGVRAPRALAGFSGEGFEVISRHADNAVWLDGHSTPYPAPFGARVRFSPSATPLGAHLPPTRLR
jgi:NAD+ kinase